MKQSYIHKLLYSSVTIIALVGFVGCRGNESQSTPDATTVSPTSTPINHALTANTPGTTQTQPADSPYYHQVYSASSSDGLTWTQDSDTPIVEHASVPLAIVQTDGTVMLYYVDASDGPERLGCKTSTDNGNTFTDGTCVIKNLSVDRTVDYSIVQLPDGRYRLYYFGSNAATGDPAAAEGDHSILSAISEDGRTFTEEGVVFSYAGLVDPDVFWNGKTWIMHVFSGIAKGNVVATSTDGTNFTYVGLLEPNGYGVTKPIQLPDNTFRMYGFKQGQQTVFYSFTSPDGLTWTQEDGERLAAPDGYEITDPFVVQTKTGNYKMYYKVSKKQTPPTLTNGEATQQ